MKYGFPHYILILIYLTLSIQNLQSAALSSKQLTSPILTTEQLQNDQVSTTQFNKVIDNSISTSTKNSNQPLQILNIDTSWFPMIKTTISFEFGFQNNDKPTLFQNNREIKAFKIMSNNKDKNKDKGKKLILKWLCRACSKDTQTLKIRFNGYETTQDFVTFDYHLLGDTIDKTVKIHTLGPDNKFFPCVINILSENGTSLEDISTKGGYGRLGSGFAFPPGNSTVELRLLAPDVAIDNFKVYVKPSKPTKIKRTFGPFKLPFSELTNNEKHKIHIEIERKRNRYPAIRSNLALLYSKLASIFPQGVIPLPAGEYVITLLPATKDSTQKRTKFEITITATATSQIDPTVPVKLLPTTTMTYTNAFAKEELNLPPKK